MIDNYQAISYARHAQSILLKTTEELRQNSPINNFFYMEYLTDNKYFHISQDLTFEERLFSESVHGDYWGEILSAGLNREGNASLLWSVSTTDDEIALWCRDLGYHHGINFYQKIGNTVRGFFFTGRDNSTLLFCQTQKKTLENFIHSFMIRYKELVSESRIQQNAASWKVPFNFPQTTTNPHSQNLFAQSAHKTLNVNGKVVLLSSRQWEILDYASKGLTMKQIARILNLSYRTIETVLMTLKRKTDSFSKSQLIDLYRFNSF